MSGCGPASEEPGYIASWVEPAAEAGAEQSVKGGGFEAAWAAPMMSQGPASKALSPLFRTRNSRGKAGHRGRRVAGGNYFIFAVTGLVCFADLIGRFVLARLALLRVRPFF